MTGYKFYAKRIVRIKFEPFDIKIRDIKFDVIKGDINYGFGVWRGHPSTNKGEAWDLLIDGCLANGLLYSVGNDILYANSS